MHICDWSDHEADVGRLISKMGESSSVAEPFLLAAVSQSAAAQFKCATDYVNTKLPAFVGPLAAKTYAHDKIRLAYLSADFHDHPVAMLMAGVFEHHDRAQFEINCFITWAAEHERDA